MTNRKISDLTALSTPATNDLVNVVDVSDTTFAATGTNKKVTVDSLSAVASDYSPSGFLVISESTAYSANTTITEHVIFKGSGKIVPDNGVTVTLSGGYTAHDYQNVFDISSGGGVIGKRSPSSYVTPFHFGATAEGASGDDTEAIKAAITFGLFAGNGTTNASGFNVRFPPPPERTGYYHVTSDIRVNRTVILEGMGSSGRLLGAINVRFSDACDAGFFFTGSTDGDYASSRSIMRGFVLSPVNAGNVDFGVVHNTTIDLEDVTCKNFNLAGFFAHGQSSGDQLYGVPWGGYPGTMEGNTNGSYYRSCTAYWTRNGPGFAARGNNSQIMVYMNCDATINNGAGFYDGSAIGNIYINCHTAQSTWKVLHNAKYYMPIKEHTSGTDDDEPGVGANWETYWVEITATEKDADWETATFYRGCGGIQQYAAVASTVIGHYSEGGIEKGIIMRGGTVLGGVVVGFNRVLKHAEIGQTAIIGGSGAASPASFAWEYTNSAGAKYGSSLGPRTGFGDIFHSFGHSDDDATATYGTWELIWDDIREIYGYSRNGQLSEFGLSGSGFSQDGYSGHSFVLMPHGVLMGGPAGFSHLMNFKVVQNNAAISGDVSAGDIFFYSDASPGGKIGARVTTAGTVGSDAVVKEFGVIDA